MTTTTDGHHVDLGAVIVLERPSGVPFGVTVESVDLSSTADRFVHVVHGWENSPTGVRRPIDVAFVNGETFEVLA